MRTICPRKIHFQNMRLQENFPIDNLFFVNPEQVSFPQNGIQ